MLERFLCLFRFLGVAFPLDQIQHLLLLGVVLGSHDFVYIEGTFIDSLAIHIIPNLVLHTGSIDKALVSPLIDFPFGDSHRGGCNPFVDLRYGSSNDVL